MHMDMAFLKFVLLSRKKPNIILCVFSIKEACQIRDLGLNNKILIFSKIEIQWLEIALRKNFV